MSNNEDGFERIYRKISKPSKIGGSCLFCGGLATLGLNNGATHASCLIKRVDYLAKIFGDCPTYEEIHDFSGHVFRFAIGEQVLEIMQLIPSKSLEFERTEK